jgi:hypothetical protein
MSRAWQRRRRKAQSGAVRRGRHRGDETAVAMFVAESLLLAAESPAALRSVGDWRMTRRYSCGRDRHETKVRGGLAQAAVIGDERSQFASQRKCGRQVDRIERAQPQTRQ